MSLPLPAAVAAALVLAIGVALTATVASLPLGHAVGAGVSRTSLTIPALAAEPVSDHDATKAARAATRRTPVG